ncbi:MAG: hypothetical protein KGS60_18890 [Verrucomicrobia bacterium]|nr:hypothetical protein [Verrucomicrobiota bacterium]
MTSLHRKITETCKDRIIALLLFAWLSGSIAATEKDLSVTVVDGLGDPIPQAEIEVFQWKGIQQAIDAVFDSPITPLPATEAISSIRLTSNNGGLVVIPSSVLGKKTDLYVGISKPGYTSVRLSLNAIESKIVVKRMASITELVSLATQNQLHIQQRLRELLAADLQENRQDLYQGAFILEGRLRPALLNLVSDPVVGAEAVAILALIADPHDVRLLVESLADTNDLSMKLTLWPEIAGSLFSPTSSVEWEFLDRCMVTHQQYSRVREAAVLTLELIDTKRSLELLTKHKAITEQASKFKEDGDIPVLLHDVDQVRLAATLGERLKLGEWRGCHPPILNERGDKSLVVLEFLRGSDFFTYIATFHRQDSNWMLQGLRETRQAFIDSRRGR